jgi:hypothetical protein
MPVHGGAQAPAAACDELPAGTTLYRPEYLRPGEVSWEDLAVMVITDFSRVMPIASDSEVTVVAAKVMILACGVRLGFVMDGTGTIQGLETASDSLGEKPVRLAHEHGGRHEDFACGPS